MASKKKKETAFSMNSDEIKYHIINSVLAGLLVLVGALIGTNGDITTTGITASIFVAFLTALNKFRDYWKTQEGEYTSSHKKSNMTLFAFW